MQSEWIFACSRTVNRSNANANASADRGLPLLPVLPLSFPPSARPSSHAYRHHHHRRRRRCTAPHPPRPTLSDCRYGSPPPPATGLHCTVLDCIARRTSAVDAAAAQHPIQ